jgi:hypothetical protein
MNRLTKKICLVLISSSLAMHGCGHGPDPEEKTEEPGNQSHSRSSHGHHTFIPWGVGRSGPVVSPSGSPSPGAGASSHFTSSGSARGGFGTTAHGGGS